MPGFQTHSWYSRREAALNWLAFGLLLAAWNAADNDAAGNGSSSANRPQELRGYAVVSVRAGKSHKIVNCL